MNLQSVLQLIQLGVGIITLASVAFYLGRHSRKMEEYGEDIGELKSQNKAITAQLGSHEFDIRVLKMKVEEEREDRVPPPPHHGPVW